MGYTRYWTNKKELSKGKFKHFSYLCEQITKVSSVRLDLGEFSDEKVSFNGVGDNSHEDFWFTRKEGFNFCKTDRKPYDEIVCACLDFAANIFADEIEVSNDGDNNDEESILKYRILVRDKKIDNVINN